MTETVVKKHVNYEVDCEGSRMNAERAALQDMVTRKAVVNVGKKLCAVVKRAIGLGD